MTDRFSERARAERRQRLLRRSLVPLLVVVLVLAGGWTVWFSSVLAARTVVVRGERSLTRAEVVAAAEVPVGRPLARIDVSAVRRRVGELLPVDSVRVSRRWPHTVVVTVTERTAVGWVRKDSQKWAVDADGVLFLVVTRMSSPELAVDPADHSALRAAARVAGQVARYDPSLAGAVTSVAAATEDSVTLHLKDGRQVVWGSTDRPADKARVLKALLKISARTYDVSAPDNPTTSQAAPSQAAPSQAATG